MAGKVETGRALQSLRLASGCCPRELGERAGVSRAMVLAVEEGVLNAPRPLLATALQMSYAGPGRVIFTSEMERLYGGE